MQFHGHDFQFIIYIISYLFSHKNIRTNVNIGMYLGNVKICCLLSKLQTILVPKKTCTEMLDLYIHDNDKGDNNINNDNSA